MTIKLIRKRLIPEETVCLVNDQIVFQNEILIITKWLPIRKRKDKMHHGVSLWYLKKGWKISNIYDSKNQLLYLHCDIGLYDIDRGKITFVDLLLDIKYWPECGHFVVEDNRELEHCYMKGKISITEAQFAINQGLKLMGALTKKNMVLSSEGYYHLPKES